MSVLFGLIHVADAIVRLEVGSVSGETLDATINPLYAVVYLGGIAASWNRKRIGYIMVLILSALSTWGFLGHTTGLTSPNLVEIGRASGVVFVFVVLVGEVGLNLRRDSFNLCLAKRANQVNLERRQVDFVHVYAMLQLFF